MNAFQGAVLVASNIIALPVAIKWYAWGHGIVPLFFLGVLVWSSSYHACDSWTDACLFSNYQLLHDLDFWFAQMVVSLSLIHLIYWVSPHPDIAKPVGIPFLQTAFIFFFGLINALVIALTNSSTGGQVLTTGAAVLTVAIYWFVYVCVYKHFPKYNWGDFLVGISFTGSSLLLFNLQNQVPEMYWIIHSLWHALGLCGAWYWASVMPLYPSWLNLGDEMNAAGGKDRPPLEALIQSPVDRSALWEAANGNLVTDIEAQPRHNGVRRRRRVGYTEDGRPKIN